MHHAGMRLRQATVADRDLLWRWRNDDEMRAQSFRTTAIPLDEHDRWLHAALADPSCLIWILLDSHGLPVGQGRIRIRGEEAELSLSVAAEQRGQGIGGVLLRLLTDQLFAERPEVVRIRAFVPVRIRRIRPHRHRDDRGNRGLAFRTAPDRLDVRATSLS
jgi:spore coat polysaccharide biosynthesis protein SpsF